MPIFEDKNLKLSGNSKEETQDFQIAWLNRRVENLEAIIVELLRDRVHYEIIDGYMKQLDNPGFGPSSAYLKGRGEQFAGLMRQNFPPEKLGWRVSEKGAKEGEAD